MSMNISGLGNTYNGINTNSKQYKALKEKGWLSGIMQNEAMMSAEERLIYETFGGRDTIIKNLMKQFDSDGDLLNANGVAGMDVTGKGTSWQQLTSLNTLQDQILAHIGQILTLKQFRLKKMNCRSWQIKSYLMGFERV